MRRNSSDPANRATKKGWLQGARPPPDPPGTLGRAGPPKMEAFNPWKDYLGLSRGVEAFQEEPGLGDSRPEAASASGERSLPRPVGPEGSPSCPFCRHNGEARHTYPSHNLKDAMGRVVCPILRGYVCPQNGFTSIYTYGPRSPPSKAAPGPNPPKPKGNPGGTAPQGPASAPGGC
ncbi:nanos homolog 3-like [Tachyglossus aculeatus]|uniref:nanos homolog 3-like n=1 Tax=Tachyglossus aculeatus TaxID=9261 RepID=UPI0018F4FF5F|nr:nanos homolog 3-like [Tachyglossus aculeatus]